ncbi:MAG: dTDP-4-dehydrorhamnose 3,5-epimerase [Mariprofundaceae bacterium]|nr:dTDP-4-dehydrorhamnose 3,5-epimerase [Mariprofundaceae bacterium]
MIIEGTSLSGSYVVMPEKIKDERGFFARNFCQKEFDKIDLNTDWVQSNISFNSKEGTVRGMHYQKDPYSEVKLVRCTMGAIYDVIIDLRCNSATYKQSFGIKLSSDNRKALYIPKGFAHGFQTLANNTEVLYQMSTYYAPEAARGIRWNDPLFNISWPLPISSITEKDELYESY